MINYKINTKDDVAKSLLDIIRPLKNSYSEGNSWLEVGHVGVHYGEKTARMEGFARVAWGLGPLWAGADDLAPELQKEAEEWRQFYLTGIINGSNPNHPEYWGGSYDFDQKIVEMAAIATIISLAKEKIWDALTKAQQDNLYNYLNQANFQQMHDNNWRYFRILINMTFRKLGLEWNEERLKNDRELIESCYVDDGWYFDGHKGQVDYYIPFAMHFYALIFAETSKDIEPEYCAILKERAEKFSHDFIYWFGNDGNEIPFGRSLTYRFAHNSYFGAMAYANVEGVGYGVMKNLTLRNLEQWLSRPIFDNGGALTVGYGYPNLFMSEPYNAAGSPYWAFKSYIMLAIPKTHKFWTCKAEDFNYEQQKQLKHSYMLITHDENDHVLSYVAGQNAKKTQGCCPQKYGKFVYSNHFGFSVARDSVDFASSASDNSICVSRSGENLYVARYIDDKFETSDQSVKLNYSILKGVDVKTVLIPCGAWHVRVHKFKNDFDIDVIDGGFSIKTERCFTTVSGVESGKYDKEKDIHTTDNSAFAVFPWGVSGVISLTGGETLVGDCMVNTNVLYNTTTLPAVTKTLDKGEHIMITLVYGDMSDKAEEKMKDIPQVEMNGDKIVVKHQGKTIEDTFLV